MHSIVFPKAGKSSVCKVMTSHAPHILKPDDVVIAVQYAGINYADILARKGLYQDAPAFPFVVGYEVSGTVTKVGSDSLQHWLHKEVMCFTRFGGYASEVISPINRVFLRPEKLSMEEAAAFPVNYLTAYLLITGIGALKSDETILIHNAGGGVGLAALQLAKNIGAKIIGTASLSKHKRLLDFGADVVIDYRKKNWKAELLKVTNNLGVELIIDPLGGSSWKTSYQLLRSTGRLGMFGVSNASNNKLELLKVLFQMPFFHPVSLLNHNKSVFGVNMGRLWHEPEKAILWMNKLTDMISQGILKPTIDNIFHYKDVDKAHDYIEERKNFGKVLLKMN